jgi:hypothetical protein
MFVLSQSRRASRTISDRLFPDETDDPGFVIKVRFEDDIHPFHGSLLYIHIYIITHLVTYVKANQLLVRPS